MNFERDFSSQGSCRVVQCQMSERSLEHRQRDIYETHKHRAYAVAYYMVGNEIEAEEVARDTFVRAFRQAEEPDGRCVDCSLVNELRDRMPLDEQAAPAEAAPNITLGGRNIKRTEMEEALKELPPNERMVFLLREIEGLSSPEVAEILDCRESTVRNHLFNARKYLRKELLTRYPEYAGSWGLGEETE